MIVARPQKEAVTEHSKTDNNGWRVEIAVSRIHAGLKINRRKENAATFYRIIPEAADEDISSMGPDIVRWYPIPIRAALRPVTWTPGISSLIPEPAARRPTVVRRRRFDVRPRFHRRGRRRQIRRLARSSVCPIPGSPLITFRNLPPIARDPSAARRHITPGAADPKKVIALVIPTPIARNPCDVVPFRPHVGRHFFDGVGRRFGHHDPRLGIERDHPGEGLMHRPAREHLCPGRIVAGLLRPAEGQVRTDADENKQHCGHPSLGSVAHGQVLSEA